jgi:hypothetical protein
VLRHVGEAGLRRLEAGTCAEMTPLTLTDRVDAHRRREDAQAVVEVVRW